MHWTLFTDDEQKSVLPHVWTVPKSNVTIGFTSEMKHPFLAVIAACSAVLSSSDAADPGRLVGTCSQDPGLAGHSPALFFYAPSHDISPFRKGRKALNISWTLEDNRRKLALSTRKGINQNLGSGA